MKNTIYLIDADDNLQALKEEPYGSEDLLQALLERYPALLAGDETDGRVAPGWLLVAREMGVPGEEDGGSRWSLDHLFLDSEGVPPLVEVKRASDTRIRREVAGQMLDYAANAVVYWPVESIRARFELNCERAGIDASERVRAFLGAASEEQDVLEEFWKKVKTNLQAGRIRMVFVADIIPVELRRIVEFLNSQMDPAEVLAVEVRQFVGGGVRTLVPRLIGNTAEATEEEPNPIVEALGHIILLRGDRGEIRTAFCISSKGYQGLGRKTTTAPGVRSRRERGVVLSNG